MQSHIAGNTTSALFVQQTFWNNFENVVNHRVDNQEDTKCYQDTLSYASSKVDYSDMNLNIMLETAGYNNLILITDSKL